MISSFQCLYPATKGKLFGIHFSEVTGVMFVFLFVLFFSAKQSLSQSCAQQWKNHDSCMKSRINDYQPTTSLTQWDRSSIRSDIQQCYRAQSCPNPFATSYQDSVRSYCFKQTSNTLRSIIQRCVSASYPNYTIPADNDVSNSLGQDMLDLQLSTCESKDNVTFAKCLATARGSRGKNFAFRNISYCQVRSNCYQKVNYDKQCYDLSAKVRDQLCKCGNKTLNITVYVQQYKTCMSKYNFAVKNDSHDYNLIALKHFSGTRYCVKSADPCGGFYGQKKISEQKPQTTKAPTTLTPENPTAASTSENTTKLPSSESTLKIMKSDDVTQTGGLDFGSLLTSGGMFPDPQQVLANAGFGNMTGPGGFDAASLFGTNFDLGSLFAHFNPFENFDVTSLFGQFGSSIDFGNLLSSFGG